jgi:hypothetical protein
MRDDGAIIEITATFDRDAFCADYCLAREIALTGSKDEATPIYCQILA